MRPLIWLSLCLVLSACGYKGSLYLPEQCERSCSAPTPAPGATPVTPATQP